MKLGSGHGDGSGDMTNAGVGGDATTGGFVVDVTIFWCTLVFAIPSTVAGKFVVDCVSFSWWLPSFVL